MSIKMPLLDDRTSEDIYKQAIVLARRYCPELTIPEEEGYFNPDDAGMVMLKLFSNMTGFLITQLNRIPEKHRLAFLDFVGIDLLPARPSRVPLTFYLAEGSSGAYVPSGTRVASSKDPEVIFETTEGLSAVPAELSAVYSLNPWEDGYTHHSKAVAGKEDGFLVLGRDAEEKPLEHILYLGDDTVLDIRKQVILTLHFEGTDISSEYFSRWYDGENNALISSPQQQSSQKLDVSLNIKKLGKTSVNKKESFWVSVRPDKRIVKGLNLPKISSIKADITVNDIMPDSAFFNNTPVDIKKGFYPFGEEPKQGDALYIGSEEAFSKEGAEITLNIELTFLKQQPAADAAVKWEYWSGSEWIERKIQDGTNAFEKGGKVVFTCPAIPPAEINGQLNRWIRVRIESGGFGTPGKLEQKTLDDFFKLLPDFTGKAASKTDLEGKGYTFGFQYEARLFNPPFINSINISYTYRDKPLKEATAFNSFQYEDFKPGDEPYKLSGQEIPALYLGFKTDIASTPIILFFAVKEKLYSEKPEVIKDPGYPDEVKQFDEAVSFSWKYYNGESWKEFGIEDETESLSRGGIIRFLAPSDIDNTFEFGDELYWIKAEIKDGKWLSCPGLKGIFQNSVLAINSVTVSDEILGSGNGESNLSLSFSKKHVLEGQVIEVGELSIPSAEELAMIESEEGGDALRKGESGGVWVRWHEVKDFVLSSPLNRHYVLDRTNGKITFGDGTYGMVPPRGKNNIVARLYRSGGGRKGDVASGTITSLKKTIPNIERVINHVPSSGGMDPETVERAVHRGPYTIKNGNRAVTKEDFEYLAQEASQYVAKARCILEKGKIKVIIVPKYESDTPLPEAGLLDSVERYLNERAFMVILNRIDVVGPGYKRVDVTVKVKPISLGESSIVSDRIKEKLRTFLHPLKGGENGEGWDFGQSIFISKMAAVIEDIEGVDYVKGIVPEKQILMEPNALPFSGDITVEIEG